MNIYRKKWINHYGEIPKDENGLTYEIHHIDGNRSNNDISNLIALSLKEHYLIHYNQGDYYAAFMISKKMKLTKQELNELKVRLKHPKSEKHKQNMSKAKKGKIFLDSHKNNLKKKKNILTCNVCGITGGANSIKRFHMENCGKYYEMKKEKCPHCGKESTKNALIRWHYDNCKQYKIPKNK
jgi:hypothetical protein